MKMGGRGKTEEEGREEDEEDGMKMEGSERTKAEEG